MAEEVELPETGWIPLLGYGMAKGRKVDTPEEYIVFIEDELRVNQSVLQATIARAEDTASVGQLAATLRPYHTLKAPFNGIAELLGLVRELAVLHGGGRESADLAVVKARAEVAEAALDEAKNTIESLRGKIDAYESAEALRQQPPA